MSEHTPAIDARGLTKRFGGRLAVDRVDLQVPVGGVHAVLGSNGAGKTTMVRMLATLMRPDAGSARILGRDLRTQAGAVRRLIGVTGQYASVDEDLTATENLVIFGRLVGSPTRTARRRASELLEEFGLTESAARPVGQFSGGMRRRLDLAASLITRPQLIFLDEPTTGLDPRTRLQLWDTVRRLVAEGSTVLLTTQYLEEADQLASRISVMDHGRVVAEGTTDELKSRVGQKYVKVSLIDGRHCGRARELCASYAGGKPVGSETDREIAVPMPDVDRLPELLITLREQGIAVEAVNVQRPTLDEVFMAMTGSARREEVA
ncbi:ATP-binding cassette domain-containing protein [Williamsia sterculiae]|uniref:ATP-binding cassette domain-containing protein n=1 Tax=Williamsia sterculiae TaxID=1344003 RepID=UPI00097045A9